MKRNRNRMNGEMLRELMLKDEEFRHQVVGHSILDSLNEPREGVDAGEPYGLEGDNLVDWVKIKDRER